MRNTVCEHCARKISSVSATRIAKKIATNPYPRATCEPEARSRNQSIKAPSDMLHATKARVSRARRSVSRATWSAGRVEVSVITVSAAPIGVRRSRVNKVVRRIPREVLIRVRCYTDTGRAKKGLCARTFFGIPHRCRRRIMIKIKMRLKMKMKSRTCCV
jgi:hypothetical protein